MMRVGFYFTSVFFGLIFHLFFRRYVSLFHAGPDFFFLMTLASGFLWGPMTGEIIGFSVGLTADVMGVSLFGLQAFMFSLTGYLAGKLRRRIDVERPYSQIVVAFVGTVIYSFCVELFLQMLDQAGYRVTFLNTAVTGVFNAVLVPFIFWGIAWWGHLWQLKRD